MRAFRYASSVVAAVLVVARARAAEDPGQTHEVRSASEITAGLSSPTPLVTPAVALPTLGARVLAGVDTQRPSGALDAARPVLTGELGLGRGVTIGLGTRWLGGDVPRTSDGLSPWAQVRWQVFGATTGDGWTGGVGLAYKQVGFGGGEREAEASFSAAYHSSKLEAGGQAVYGQSLRDAGEIDVELRAYGAVRVADLLAVGVAGQGRLALGEVEPTASTRRGDLLGGGLVTAYIGPSQIGVFGGASTVGLGSGLGVFGQAFATYRF